MRRSRASDRSLRRALWGLSLAASLCAPNRAGAQSPEAGKDPGAEERRASLYKEGKELTLAERWGEAIEKFEQVVAIRSAPPALYALALAQERAGRLATAKKTYERAARDAQAAGDAKMAAEADEALRALGPRVPRIQLRITGASRGVQIRVDRTAVAAPSGGRSEIEVDPGTRLLEVAAEGSEPYSREITLRAGQVETVAVELRARKAATSSAPGDAPATTEGGGPPVGAIVLGGAGVALGIAGAVLRFTAQSDYDAARDGCDADARCPDASVTDDGNAARSRIIVGTVLLGAGGAALVGGGLWWALSGSGGSKTSAHHPRGVGVSLGVAGGGFQTALRGKF